MIRHRNGSLCMIFVWRLNHITYYRFCFEFPLIRDEPKKSALSIMMSGAFKSTGNNDCVSNLMTRRGCTFCWKALLLNLCDERIQEGNTSKIKQGKRQPQTMIAPHID